LQRDGVRLATRPSLIVPARGFSGLAWDRLSVLLDGVPGRRSGCPYLWLKEVGHLLTYPTQDHGNCEREQNREQEEEEKDDHTEEYPRPSAHVEFVGTELIGPPCRRAADA
jgi:hypothetical protein